METLAEKPPTLRNIVILSIGFMLLMASWITAAAIVQIVLQSVRVEDPTFDGDGYISMALINGVFSLSNFITPPVVSFVGLRTCLVLGPLSYALFISSFLYTNTIFLYATSIVLGFAAANLWVANGIYFTRCSTKETIGKNMGIYWSIMSLGQLFGSGYVYWQFQGMSHIDKKTRYVVGGILAGISVLSSASMLFLGRPSKPTTPDTKLESNPKIESEAKADDSTPSFCTTFTQPFRLLTNKHMILLIPSFLYNGLEISFFMGIYPTAVGFTGAFGSDARKLVGLVGILTGVGTLTAGLLFGVFGDKLVKSKRYVILSIACVCHCTCSLLSWINLPNGAPLGPTNDVSWLTSPSVPIAMLCAFLLGIGDGCVTPQVCAAIGVIWPDNPSPALACYRFFQAATCAAGFYVGTLTGLYNQILIFTAVGIFGTVTFWVNEAMIEKKHSSKEAKVKPVLQVSMMKKRFSTAGHTNFY